MRIDDVEQQQARLRREQVIRQIQRYQDQQGDIQDPKKPDASADAKKLDDAQALEQDAARGLERRAEALRADEQAALQNSADKRQDVAATETSGATKHAQAVDAASTQQDAGEVWQDFAQRGDARSMPPSVEEMAKEQSQAGSQQDEQRLQARDLQNELAVKNRQIRG